MGIVREYPHRLAGHCGSGALRDLLEWANLTYTSGPLDEGFVFGLGGDLSFRYMKGPGLDTPFYLVGRGADLTARFCNRLGIEYEVRVTEDPDLGWRWLRDEVDLGYPLLLWADMRELPYLNVRMHMSRHDIVAIGYDYAQATVVDNDRESFQRVSHIQLIRARNSLRFPIPTRNTCYPMRFPKKLPDLLVTAASALRASAENMLEVNPPPFSRSRGIEFVEASGIAGVEFFARDVERWGHYANDDQLTVAHSILAIFIEKAGTGGGLFRRLQSDFLAQLYKLTADPAVSEAATKYHDLAAAWSFVAAEARDPLKTPALRQCALIESVRDLPGLERAAVASLLSAADSLIKLAYVSDKPSNHAGGVGNAD